MWTKITDLMALRTVRFNVLLANLVPMSWELFPWFCGECVKSPVEDHLFALLRLLWGGPFDFAVGDLDIEFNSTFNSNMHNIHASRNTVMTPATAKCIATN